MAATRSAVLDRLSALADPTRNRILLLLDRFELSVGDLCVIPQLPQSTVSRHLKVLADDGWVAARGEGTSRFYAMVPSRLDDDARELWLVVRAQAASGVNAAEDARRAERVLAKRRLKMRVF